MYIKKVSVKTDGGHIETEIGLELRNCPACMVHQTVLPAVMSGTVSEPVVSAEIFTGIQGETVISSAEASPVVRWSLDEPVLYWLVTELLDEAGDSIEVHRLRFGFRDITSGEAGLHLNGISVSPYFLPAQSTAPYLERKDGADILKYELGLNGVFSGTHVLPEDFLLRCDEIGLLVFPASSEVDYTNHPSVYVGSVAPADTVPLDCLENNPDALYAFYRSQRQASLGGYVLEVSSSTDWEDLSAEALGDLWIYTNADSVRFYKDGCFIKEYTKEDSPYGNLAHGPVLVDDFIGSRLETEEKLPPKAAQRLAKLFNLMRNTAGKMNDLSMSGKILALKVIMLNRIDKNRIHRLYKRYMTGKGKDSAYRFESVSSGKIVQTFVKNR